MACSVAQDVICAFALSFVRVCHSRTKFCMISASGKRGFHGRFYGLRIFGCKTAQFCATPCEPASSLVSSEKHAAQHPEKLCQKSPLNFGYVSPLDCDGEQSGLWTRIAGTESVSASASASPSATTGT
jgi:hypothetical protein